MPRGDKGGKSKGSGIRCVAANCGNTNADGVSLHTFPKDPTLLKKWSDFVKLKRGAWSGPTEYSALCSIHFEPSCFPFRTRFEIEQMGVRPKRVTLTSVACPTIHTSRPVETTTPSKSSSTQSLTPSTPAAQSHLTAENRLQMLSPSEDILYQSSPPKKIRRGYMKREAARIIESSFESEPGTEEPSREEPTDNDSLAAPLATQQANMVKQVEQPKQCSKVSIGFQCSIRPSQRSKSCQTNTVAKEGRIIKHKISVGCQTDLETKPKMVNAFAYVKPQHFETRERNISCSSHEGPVSSPMVDDPTDETYKPISDHESDNEENSGDEVDGNNTATLHDQRKFLVFENCLLELFKICCKCLGRTKGEVVQIYGSMIKIKQTCDLCDHTREWCSQPMVGNTPAGNLLMSAGILFSGSIPSNVLKMFKTCNIACISTSTFINHQSYYLFPSIAHVWFNYQQDYLNDCKQEDRSVVLGGDGRSDTPGHSAKFGSYTAIDLEEGSVVDVQLVQSNEVKSSVHMEKEGLIRCVKAFSNEGIQIQTLVTDRHVQIVKWVREDMPDTTHCFDVWHVAKEMCGEISQEHMWILRLVGLVIGCLAKFVTGSLCVFNVYQQEIKTTFNLTQQEVETQSSLLNLGLGVGFLPGILYDKCGPKWTSLAGLVISVGAYLLLWSTPKFPKFYGRNSWLMALYFFLCGLGSVFTYMVALNTNVINFDRKYRGLIIGTLNGFFAGSPSVFSVVYYKGLTGDHKFGDFMLMFAICFAVVDILCIIFLRLYTTQPEEETVLIISPEKDHSEHRKLSGSNDCHVSYQTENSTLKTTYNDFRNVPNEPLTLKQLLLNIDYQLFTWMFVFAASIGLTFVNNVTVIAKCLHLDQHIGSIVLVLPITAAVVSIVIGLLSDILYDKVPRMTILVGACVCFTLSQTIVLVFGNLYAFLIFGTFLCGVAISAIWSLSSAVMGEVFSLKHIGRNWGIALMIAALFGMLTQEIFGVTYDAHVPDGKLDCFGMKCVSGGLGFSIAAGILSIILGSIYIIKKGQCS